MCEVLYHVDVPKIKEQEIKPRKRFPKYTHHNLSNYLVKQLVFW